MISKNTKVALVSPHRLSLRSSHFPRFRVSKETLGGKKFFYVLRYFLCRCVSLFCLSVKWDVRVGGWALLDAVAVLRML